MIECFDDIVLFVNFSMQQRLTKISVSSLYSPSFYVLCKNVANITLAI